MSKLKFKERDRYRKSVKYNRKGKKTKRIQ